MKTYTIAEIEFTQDKISLKNLRQIVTILSSMEFPKDLTAFKLISSLGEKLPEMFSLVLKGKYPDDKNRSVFLDENMDDEQVILVIQDFLASRPIYKKLLDLLPKIG